MNYKEEIKLRIEEELHIQCSISKFLGEFESYHFLYKTTNSINGKIYIGIKSTREDPEKCCYLGSGIYKGRKIHANPFGKSFIKKALTKYGTENFIREDLVFFHTRKEAALAERLIVDEDFVKRTDTYNLNLGGQIPPRKVGCENGNYNNRWSLEKREKFSEYLRIHRDTKGDKNSNAKKIYLYDAWEDQWTLYSSLTTICNKLEWKYNTGESFFRKQTITDKRYILSREILSKEVVERIISNSRFKKQIYANRKKH